MHRNREPKPVDVLLGKIKQAKEKIACSTVPKKHRQHWREKIINMLIRGEEEAAEACLNTLRQDYKRFPL